nr:MAG TPA: hypothetical protein [Caudoviricetes sp.]
MKEEFSKQDIFDIGFAVVDAVRNYSITIEDIIDAIQVYAEWQEIIGDASLYDTLWMEDCTPMSPSLTRYLYHKLYGLEESDYNGEEDYGDE